MRAKKVKEVITSIKMLKFNALEDVVIQEIKEYRAKEKRSLMIFMMIRGSSRGLGIFFPLICMLCSIYLHSLIYGQLDLGSTYSIILLFGNIIHPISVVLFALNRNAAASASDERIKILYDIKSASDTP